MSKVKISICVPVYNAENYLRECLDSIQKQTFRDIEVICVNDGSTDSSLKILKEFANKDKRFVIINQKNKGLGAARDAGVKKASGEFVGFVDADDVIDEKMYEVLYKLATEKNAEIAYCNLSLFPDRNNKKKIWFNPYKGKVDGVFLHRNTQPWNKIFSHSLFDRAGVSFKKNDSLCVLLMVEANGIVSTNEKLYHYRVGHSSMSSSYKLSNFVDTFDMLVEIRKRVQKDIDLNKKLGDYFDFKIINALFQILYVSVLKGKNNTYKKYKKTLKKMNYKKNDYCEKLLKPEYGKTKYFAIVNILPRNYIISRLLICYVLGKGKND